jgi:hypothetical protein
MRGLRPLRGRCPKGYFMEIITKRVAYTLKPQYNNPFNNKIPAIKNLISSPSVVNSIVKSPSNNKISAIKNKIFGPFKFVILRFPCSPYQKYFSKLFSRGALMTIRINN